MNRGRSSDPRHALGRLGEKAAARHLKSAGYKVLARRFRPRRGGGEVDIVCRHGETLVFAEVKTRASDGPGRPLDAVGPEKEGLIIRAAMEWLRLLHHPEIFIRFDVVEVVIQPGKNPTCHVVEAAFTLPEHYIY